VINIYIYIYIYLTYCLHLLGTKEVNECKNAWSESFKIGE